jgi:ribosomal protein S27E
MTTATEIKCEQCGAPATLWHKEHAEGACEACARHWIGFRAGQAYAVGHMIENLVEVARAAGASRDEIHVAVDRALDNREPALGAMLAIEQARMTECKAGLEGSSESQRLALYFEPLGGA